MVESQLAYMWEVTSFTGLNNISTITDTASTAQLYIPPGKLSPDAQYTFTCQAIPTPPDFFFTDILVLLCRIMLCIFAPKLSLYKHPDLADTAKYRSNVIRQQRNETLRLELPCRCYAGTGCS